MGPSPEAYFTRRRWLGRCVGGSLGLLALGWGVVERLGDPSPHGLSVHLLGLPPARGVLLRVSGQDGPVEVRLLGLLSVPPMADRTRAAVQAWAGGQPLSLAVARWPMRDERGRAWVYADLADGSRLNERLLAAGLAEATSRPEHPDVERYRLIQEQAQRDKRGVWRGW